MAGINQTIMLALSMVVIAAMIGAKGLGGRFEGHPAPGTRRGFEAGIAIVIVAMILDRSCSVSESRTINQSEQAATVQLRTKNQGRRIE